MKEQEQELFAKWKGTEKEGWKRKKFIPDGIVDVQSYLDSKIKVLYILKETNGFIEGGLAKYLKGGGRASTWNNVTRWQYGITNIYKDIRWGEIETISNETRKSQLKNIAIMNLKKEPGEEKAVSKQIWNYALEDKDLLKEQIQIYSPDVIICCGTGDIVKKLELIKKFNKWEKSSYGVSYYQSKDQIIIDYYHPAYYGESPKKLFYPLYKTLKEILGILKTE